MGDLRLRLLELQLENMEAQNIKDKGLKKDWKKIGEMLY